MLQLAKNVMDRDVVHITTILMRLKERGPE